MRKVDLYTVSKNNVYGHRKGGTIGTTDFIMVMASDYEVALAREAALRDDVGEVKGEYDRAVNKVDALQQHLTVTEQRADDLEGLLRGALRHVPNYGNSDWEGSLRHQINEALKPAEGEGS